MTRILPLAVFVAWGFNAQAFVVELNSNGDPLRWHLDPPDPSVDTNVVNPNTKAIRYFLASDAYSTTNTAAELNALRASFAQWEAIPGTVLKFEEGGLVPPQVDVNTSDNQNVVFWTKKTDLLVNGEMDNINGALGVTFNSYFTDNNAQAEADILGHREVRKERVALEDVADTSRLRRHVDAGCAVEEHAPVHDDATRVRCDESRQALQRQRLAGAGRAEQHGHAPAGRPRDVQIEAGHLQRERDLEPIAHVALAPSRLAATITTHDSALSTTTSSSAAASSPVCTAV